MPTSFGRITIFAVLLLTLATGGFLLAILDTDEAISYEPKLHITAFELPNVSALSVAVFDVETGEFIVTKDADATLPIASVTKLLAASVFYDSANLDATTSIVWSDVNTEGDAGKLHPYEEYTYRELMYPLLLESSNDAASALLRVSPDLLTRMGAYTQSLGLLVTTFNDTSGLSDKNVSTATELSLLFRDLYKNSPHVFDITRLKQFVGTHTGWLNNNPLIAQEGYRGGKHGFTNEANRTAVAFFDETIATGQVRTMGYVLLQSDDLKADIALLREAVHKNVSLK